jgi:hypothetical protein
MPRHTTLVQPYQVRVVIGGKPQTKRFDARGQHQAIEKAQDSGYRVIGARKAELVRQLPQINNIKLLEPLFTPRDTAIAMENIAFRRVKRLENKNKYEKDVDNS